MKVTPSTTYVLGVDVSAYQSSVDWQAARAAGVAFAGAKTTEGTYYRDAQFGAYWDGMKQAGVIRCAYHFFKPSYDPAA